MENKERVINILNNKDLINNLNEAKNIYITFEGYGFNTPFKRYPKMMIWIEKQNSNKYKLIYKKSCYYDDESGTYAMKKYGTNLTLKFLLCFELMSSIIGDMNYLEAKEILRKVRCKF